MLNLAIEIIGWIGAALLVVAYILVSTGRTEGRSKSYQLLNLGGAVAVGINSGWNGAFPSVGINIVWIVIGLRTLLCPARTAERKLAQRP